MGLPNFFGSDVTLQPEIARNYEKYSNHQFQITKHAKYPSISERLDNLEGNQ